MLKIGQLNLLFSILVIVSNTINLIYLDLFNAYEVLTSVIPFLCTAILFFLVRNNNIFNSYILVAIGLLASLVGSYSNTVGVTLACFACEINKNNSFKYIALTGLLISLVCKNFLIELSVTNLLSTIILYVFIITVYFSVTYRDKEKPLEDSLLTFGEHEVLIFKSQGFTDKEIVDKLSEHVSVHTVRKRIQRACGKYKCKTSHELIFRLSQLGHLTNKYDKVYKI